MIPSKIGRYEIRSELGHGGMATVYLAYDPNMKREVAIKVLPAAFLHEPAFRLRFEREAETIAAVEFQSVVPVYDYGEENGQPYLVMRYMTGKSLVEKIERGPLSLIETSEIFKRLGPALDHVHAKGIIHRDIKPANILFDMYDNAYLSDFGIAHITRASTTLTGEGLVGTPAYMSPEQAKGDVTLDGRSDIYGLGVILFETLTGHQPYEATTPMGVAIKHLNAPVPRLMDYINDISPECQAVIERAMAKDRSQRYPTGASLAQALNMIANKTLKNPPVVLEEPTARITPAHPLRIHPPRTPPAPASASPSAKPLTPPPPVFNPPSKPPISPAPPVQPQPGRTPPAQHLAPPAQQAQPVSKPQYLQPVVPETAPARAIPRWLWGVIAAAALLGLCLAIVAILWVISTL